MAMTDTAMAVPHSAGTRRPARMLPPLACDSHMHIFDARFAPSPHWPRTPPQADVAMYRQLQQRLAVVAQDVADAELDRLAAHRVCGLRVNFVSPQSWGETTAHMLVTLAHRVERLGWHVQVFVQPEQLVALAPVLGALPVPLVVDHLGRIDPAQGAAGAAHAALRRLLDGGNTWVKLSGAYMRSSVHGPSYADTLPLGRDLVRAAPERLVWGSDWPHTTESPGSVDDADLVDLLLAWAGTDEALDRAA
jgi:predicted TIM-barrel fold metal-dependent hydrolase